MIRWNDDNNNKMEQKKMVTPLNVMRMNLNMRKIRNKK